MIGILVATTVLSLLLKLSAAHENSLLDKSHQVELSIALRPKAGGLETLHRTILEVSTPKSAKFRKVKTVIIIKKKFYR